MSQKVKIVPLLIAVPIVLILISIFFATIAGGFASESASFDRGGLSKGESASIRYASSSSYWSYNPFQDSVNMMLFVLFCIAAPIITMLRLNGQEWKTVTAAALGTFFIAGALIVTVGAFQNLLSMHPNSSSSIEAGDLYGWVFLDIILLAIGAALLFISEKWRAVSGGERSVYSAVAHTAGLFIALYAAVLFVVSSFEAVDILKSSMDGSTYANEIVLNPIRMFGWLIYSAALFSVSYKILEFSKKTGGGIGEYSLHTPVSYAGAVALCGAAIYTIIFLLGAVSALTGDSGSDPELSIFEPALALVLNAVALYAAFWLCTRQEKLGIPRTGHLWLVCLGACLVLISLFAMVYALYEILSADSSSDTWRGLLFFLLLLGYAGGLMFAAMKFTSSKYKEKRAQEGSLVNFVYGEEEAPSGKPAGSEIALLNSRIARLEARVARLESGKKK